MRWILPAGLFLLILTWVMLDTRPPSPPADAEHSSTAAAAACLRSVRDSVADAHFPFPANVVYAGDALYRLSGTVESDRNGEPVRQNYACVIRYEAARYRADTVTIWQSH